MRESILTKLGAIYSQELPEVCAATGVRNHHETDWANITARTLSVPFGVRFSRSNLAGVPTETVRSKSTTAEFGKRQVVAPAIEQSTWGQVRVSNELKKQGLSISPFGMRAGGELAGSDIRIHMPTRQRSVSEGEGHGQAVSKANRRDPIDTGAMADYDRGARTDEYGRAGAMNSTRSLGAIRLDIVVSRDEIDHSRRDQLAPTK